MRSLVFNDCFSKNYRVILRGDDAGLFLGTGVIHSFYQIGSLIMPEIIFHAISSHVVISVLEISILENITCR